jgi:hypothetical protein
LIVRWPDCTTTRQWRRHGVSWRGISVGYAHLRLEGDVATLEDIHINDDAPAGTNLWRDLLRMPKRKNFRGIGIGSALHGALARVFVGNLADYPHCSCLARVAQHVVAADLTPRLIPSVRGRAAALWPEKWPQSFTRPKVSMRQYSRSCRSIWLFAREWS